MSHLIKGIQDTRKCLIDPLISHPHNKVTSLPVNTREKLDPAESVDQPPSHLQLPAPQSHTPIAVEILPLLSQPQSLNMDPLQMSNPSLIRVPPSPLPILTMFNSPLSNLSDHLIKLPSPQSHVTTQRPILPQANPPPKSEENGIQNEITLEIPPDHHPILIAELTPSMKNVVLQGKQDPKTVVHLHNNQNLMIQRLHEFVPRL